MIYFPAKKKIILIIDRVGLDETVSKTGNFIFSPKKIILPENKDKELTVLKIAIDIDNTITEYPELFVSLTKALSRINDIEIIILTFREISDESYKNTKNELDEIGIKYDHLIITDNKQKYIKDNNISVFVDDTDENFKGLGPEICCLKIREEGNYDFNSHRWVYSDNTGQII